MHFDFGFGLPFIGKIEYHCQKKPTKIIKPEPDQDESIDQNALNNEIINDKYRLVTNHTGLVLTDEEIASITSLSITFIRHGESTYNRWGKWIDQVDCPLTTLGRAQAEQLDLTFDLLIFSPLKRSLETLLRSQLKAYEVEITHLCREHQTNLCDFIEGEIIQPESEKELLFRIENFKQYLKKQIIRIQKEKGILRPKIGVLTHADFYWYLSSNISEGERFGTWLANCEIAEYELII